MSLSNTQYDSIMRSYAERQANARRDLEERLEIIQKQIPALSRFDEAIAALQGEKVRAAIEGRTADKENAARTLEQLRRERLELLAAHGVTPADLEPVYECPDCQDTGYIGTDKCHCFKQAEIDLLYSQSHLKEVLERENFTTFSYSWYKGADLDIMKRNVMEARIFIENFERDFQNLLLLGGVGTGKTFLSNCIAKELIDTGHSVVYLTAFQLFDLLSKTTFGTGPEEAAAGGYSYILSCDLLIIDDLGTELVNSFTVSQFFLCINERILRQKSTLISSNLDVEALRNIYSERTFSRIISNYNIRQLPGKDIRIKKKLRMNT